MLLRFNRALVVAALVASSWSIQATQSSQNQISEASATPGYGQQREVQVYHDGSMLETDQAPPVQRRDVLDAIIAADGGGETDKHLLVTVVREVLESRDDQLQPFCIFFHALNRLGLSCSVVRWLATRLIQLPPDFHAITNEKTKMEFEDEKPGVLADLRGKLPERISPEMVREEKQIYAWYQRQVQLMYEYTFDYADETKGQARGSIPPGLVPKLPPGFGDQRIYMEHDPQGWSWPLAQSAVKGDQLLFIFRGSIFSGFWQTNFKYHWASVEHTQALGIPGRVHAGYVSYARNFFSQFDASRLAGIRRITLAGHSAGGALATVVGASLAASHPDVVVSVVSIGCPMIGDKTFADFITQHVNLRRLVYLGAAVGTAPGLSRVYRGWGDGVTQLPTACHGAPMPGCGGGVLTDLAVPFEEPFAYEPLNGTVPIFATDLVPNVQRWLRTDQIDPVPGEDTFIQNSLAKHICSYTCWLAQAVNRVEGRCFFPGDPGNHTDVCDIAAWIPLTQRFPWLKDGPPKLRKRLRDM